ncbi:MAG: hypothetical protein ACREV4_09400 [Gammaproteobacteria bacterium]
MRSYTLAKFVVIAALCFVGSASANELQEERTIVPGRSFAIYALSRGKGVPEAGREVLRKVRAWLDEAKRAGSVVDIRQTRIGLEGETRLCAEFADSESTQAMLKRVRVLAEDVELMNLVVEPCDGG